MDYSKFFRQATGLALMGALAIGCTKDDAGTDGTDSSIMISPSVLSTADAAAGDGNPSGAVNENMPLTLYFMRADGVTSKRGGGYDNVVYNDGELAATRPAGEGKQNLTFTSPGAQYYNMDGSKTLMRGWFPKATFGEDEYGTYVEWTFDGSQDIMVSNCLVGDREDKGIDGPDHWFAFEHMLTQLQFYAYGETAAAAQAWGKVKSIVITRQSNTCFFDPAPNDEDPEGTPLTECCDFSGSKDLSVYNLPSEGVSIPAKATEAGMDGLYGAAPAGIIMIEPAGRTFSATAEITVQLPDGTEETTEVEIPAEGASVESDFAAGQSTKIMLNFLTRDIQVTLMPADWIEVSGDNMDVDLGVDE